MKIFKVKDFKISIEVETNGNHTTLDNKEDELRSYIGETPSGYYLIIGEHPVTLKEIEESFDNDIYEIIMNKTK